METMRPKPPSPIAGHPGANPAYEAWAHRHRLTRAAVYRTRTRDGGLRPGWTVRVYAGPWRTISCGFPTREAALTWANHRVYDERVWEAGMTSAGAVPA